MLLARAGNVEIGDGRGLALIAGPCVIESEDLCMEVAARAKEITESSDPPTSFKASFDARELDIGGVVRGPGLDKGLTILAAVKSVRCLCYGHPRELPG